MPYRSETDQFRQYTLPYCVGNGIDVGSGGDPVKVDGCISFDQGGEMMADVALERVVHLRGDARYLYTYFRKEVFDYLYSSHLLEDFPLAEWHSILSGWVGCVKVGGNVVILVPDRDLYHAHTPVGANQNHRHEPVQGELSAFFAAHLPYCDVLEERLLAPYTIMLVARVRERYP